LTRRAGRTDGPYARDGVNVGRPPLIVQFSPPPPAGASLTRGAPSSSSSSPSLTTPTRRAHIESCLICDGGSGGGGQASVATVHTVDGESVELIDLSRHAVTSGPGRAAAAAAAASKSLITRRREDHRPGVWIRDGRRTLTS